MKMDVEIIGFEQFYRNGKPVKKVVFRVKGERIFKDLEIDPNRNYSEEELKEVILSHLTRR